ncbi:MAG: biopolymer transporter ExbD [Verrucomicrobiota bacterium]
MTVKFPAAERVSIPLAPMIDCVFLILIYFMVSATLDKQEADLAFRLPGTASLDMPLSLPDDVLIAIRGDGQVLVNDYAYDVPTAAEYVELAAMLTRMNEASAAAKTTPSITLLPEPETRQEAIVKVMDACAQAGIADVSFASSGR